MRKLKATGSCSPAVSYGRVGGASTRQRPAQDWAGKHHPRAIQGPGGQGGGSQIPGAWEGFLAMAGFHTAPTDRGRVAGWGGSRVLQVVGKPGQRAGEQGRARGMAAPAGRLLGAHVCERVPVCVNVRVRERGGRRLRRAL